MSLYHPCHATGNQQHQTGAKRVAEMLLFFYQPTGIVKHVFPCLSFVNANIPSSIE